MASTSEPTRISRLPLPSSPRVSRIPQPSTLASSPKVPRATPSAIPRGPSATNTETRRVVNAVPVTPSRTARPLVSSRMANPADAASSPGLTSRPSSNSAGSPRPASARPASRSGTSLVTQTPFRLRTAASSFELRGSPTIKPKAAIRSQASVDTLRQSSSSAEALAPPKSPSRVSIREQIAAKRKALLDAAESSGRAVGGASSRLTKGPARNLSTAMSGLAIDDLPSVDPSADIFGRTIPTLIRKAMTTGRLDVANMSLDRLPKELWTKILGLSGHDLPQYDEPTKSLLSQQLDELQLGDGAEIPPHELERRKRAAEDEIMNVPFYEVEDLAVIKASGNSLTFVEAQIGMVGALKNLDLHSNQLRSLPDSLINLRELSVLDVSDNLLSAIPASIILSPSLTMVNLSRNRLTSISWDDPARPNQEVLQSRKDNSFFDSFSGTPTKSEFHDNDVDEIMPAVKTMALGGNAMTNAGLPSRWPKNIESIDLSDNKLQGVLDLTAFASLPRLKHLNLRGNGISSVLVESEEEDLWRSLECINLEKNEIRIEAALVERLRLGRVHTTGDALRGVVQIKLLENPIIYNAIKKPHPATVAHRAAQALADEVVHLEAEILPLSTSTGTATGDWQPTGPLIKCWNEQHQSLVVTRNTPIDCLKDGILDFQHMIDAIPGTSQLRSTEISGVLSLKGLTIPQACDRLEHVKTFSITNTSLKIDDMTLVMLAQAMPRLETLDLSGSRIDHIHGLEQLCANGLKRLLVKGCRITDISSLNDIAIKLHSGRWKGALRLEEVDIRDNSVEKLESVLGCLPLRLFLVENNAFRVPHRRVWEKEGTSGLLRWLRDGL